MSDLYDPREQWASYVINALKAKELQLKDVNYIVKGEEVRGGAVLRRQWDDCAPVGRAERCACGVVTPRR